MVLSPIYSTGLTTQLRCMYLMHIFILVPTFAWVTSWGIGTPTTIFVSALLTFLFCAGIARLISFLPKSKYLIG